MVEDATGWDWKVEGLFVPSSLALPPTGGSWRGVGHIKDDNDMPEDGVNSELGALRSGLCMCPSNQLLELYLCSCPVSYPPLLPKEIDLKIQVCNAEWHSGREQLPTASDFCLCV